jgi:hypothetical protein
MNQSKQEIEAGHGRHKVLRKKEQGTPHGIKQEPELRAGQMKSPNRETFEMPLNHRFKPRSAD